MTELIKSVYDNQHDILKSIMDLNNIDRFDADCTYGNGVFYRNLPEPRLKFDIDESLADVTNACSCNLPLESESIESLVFDPPFLTYIRNGKSGNGNMILSKRFAGYWRYDELEEHYRKTLIEAHRVLKQKGILVFKCQDIIHNHRMHCTHGNILKWSENMFRLKDLFVLTARHRLPSPNRKGTQKHARIYHSYFLVLEKVK